MCTCLFCGEKPYITKRYDGMFWATCTYPWCDDTPAQIGYGMTEEAAIKDWEALQRAKKLKRREKVLQLEWNF